MIGVELVTGWVRSRRAVRRRFNPYIAGTPVFDKRLFFGREPLAQLTLGWLASQSVQLTGERRIGKTSFLHHLMRRLNDCNVNGQRAFPVFVDLEAVPAHGVFRALIDETIDALGVSGDAEPERRARTGAERYTELDFGRDARSIVAQLRERTGGPVRLVLLIDEIDAPCGSPMRAVDTWLGPLLHEGPDELRVVAADAACAAEPAAPPGPAVLQRVELEPLTPEDGEALAIRPVAGVFRYEPRAVERILELSRLRPFEIQRRCRNAVERMLDAHRSVVRLADVEPSS
jgi:hypothetical protein